MSDTHHNGAGLSANLLRKWVGRISPGGKQGRLLTVKYHRAENSFALATPTRSLSDFENQISLLRHAFNPLTVAEAARGLREGTLPERALCITFDDGYADNYDVALPILKKHDVRATFFVTSGLLDRPSMWSDQIASVFAKAGDNAEAIRRYLADAGMPVRYSDLMNKLKYMSVDAQETIVRGLSQFSDTHDIDSRLMGAEQIRGLVEAGMEVGGHTVNHTILTNVDAERARTEIRDCKLRLEEIIGQPVVSFAYPNGRRGQDYADQHVQFVKEAGFEAAVNTEFGVARDSGELFELPRIPQYFVTPLRLARVYL